MFVPKLARDSRNASSPLMSRCRSREDHLCALESSSACHNLPGPSDQRGEVPRRVHLAPVVACRSSIRGASLSGTHDGRRPTTGYCPHAASISFLIFLNSASWVVGDFESAF